MQTVSEPPARLSTHDSRGVCGAADSTSASTLLVYLLRSGVSIQSIDHHQSIQRPLLVVHFPTTTTNDDDKEEKGD